MKKGDCSGNAHAPCENITSGQRRSSTVASRRTLMLRSSVPVPGTAGYQITVSSGRGCPVVSDVFVNVIRVRPTA